MHNIFAGCARLRPVLPQVVVLTQEFGQAYYHFLVDNLPRITVLLDVLIENKDIKVYSLHIPFITPPSRTTPASLRII